MAFSFSIFRTVKPDSSKTQLEESQHSLLEELLTCAGPCGVLHNERITVAVEKQHTNTTQNTGGGCCVDVVLQASISPVVWCREYSGAGHAPVIQAVSEH